MPYEIRHDLRRRLDAELAFEPPIDDDSSQALGANYGNREPDTVQRKIWEATMADLRARPRIVRVKPTKPRGISAVINWRTNKFLVNEAIRAFLAAEEPGAHGFFPMTVRSKSGKPIDGQPELTYHMITSYPNVDCFDRPDDRDRAMRRAAIAGHHLWKGTDQWRPYFFYSDALHAFLAANKFEGWRVEREFDVVD